MRKRLTHLWFWYIIWSTPILRAAGTLLCMAMLGLVCLAGWYGWQARTLPVRQIVNILTTTVQHIDNVAQSADGTVKSAKRLVDEARPKVNRALDGTGVSTENAAALTAHLRSDTMPLANANLIHADLTLGNLDRFSENQAQYHTELLGAAQEAHLTATAIRQRVQDPAVQRIEQNFDVGMARVAELAGHMDKSSASVENMAANGDKKLAQLLFPIRTAKQKVAAAGRWIGEAALEIWLHLH